jgi:type II secretory pathway pseudopilin PulG
VKSRRGSGGRGFTYIGVLFLVALMGIGLALAGEVWRTAAMREREADLLQAGSEYRKAIERYYLGGARQYPRALADLVQDPRQPGVARYLRKLYPDPVTGKDEWGLVKAPDGGIAGVHSLSEEAPLKSAGFAVRDRDFEGAARYSDWKFVYSPLAPPVDPAAKPPAASGER